MFKKTTFSIAVLPRDQSLWITTGSKDTNDFTIYGNSMTSIWIYSIFKVCHSGKDCYLISFPVIALYFIGEKITLQIQQNLCSNNFFFFLLPRDSFALLWISSEFLLLLCVRSLWQCAWLFETKVSSCTDSVIRFFSRTA